jgi:hypothetical protein
MYMSLEVCCCSSNLRFNLYCLLHSAFFCFLTASMLISAILVTRCACATLHSFCFFVHCVTSRTRYDVCAVSKVIRNNRAVRHIHVKTRLHSCEWRSDCLCLPVCQMIKFPTRIQAQLWVSSHYPNIFWRSLPVLIRFRLLPSWYSEDRGSNFLRNVHK